MSEPNELPDTGDELRDPSAGPAARVDEYQPQFIGRYRVERTIGQGGFGRVFLGRDEQLNRAVAIKVPHAKLVAKAEDAEACLNEARTAASLDHPHIVPVFDVGSTDQFPCFIVSKYVDGTDLARRLRQQRLSFAEVAEIVATVAEALQYAHKQAIVHRDIKPANILIDQLGKPFIADFGLALREREAGKGHRYAGTPAYMSPEQARGEGHRVDGRSDIFSLGIVFYEMLVGRRPFRAESPSELMDQIANADVRPPRQFDDLIPKPLERICLKALTRRAADRYTAAKDFADDLRHFLEDASELERSAMSMAPPAPTAAPAAGTPAATATPTPSDQPIVRVVPKGLRSFDEHDADFFLELLPGARDRDGLPDSIRFWKTRIEQMDQDGTFRVGLIYGPSGCGKSSLVRAGLLPRIAPHIVTLYVEATGDETEARLIRLVRKHCVALDPNYGLVQSLAAVRRGQILPPGQKLLIVLDQFEQWLFAKRQPEDTELVAALRHCDGEHLQAIVLVRDDFWMAITQFMRDLEVDLVPDRNVATVDRFDLRHARKVLAAFGRAYSALPERAGDVTAQQARFLEQVVSELAQDGKVISVRLALFAEMIKGKPWVPETLRAVGGTAGVGVTFLEETFASPQANPKVRLHQRAAQAVLRALLPERGSDIKGRMRPQSDLLEASGYAGRPREFADLIHILDRELHLITPTESEGQEVSGDRLSVSGEDVRGDRSQLESPTTDNRQPLTAHPISETLTTHHSQLTTHSYYQLTHDYLVPSLREWLTRKQKESRRGRAELLLADRASVWTARPEVRQLPSLIQWATIHWLTNKNRWTEPQRKMMNKAGRYHAARGLALAGVLLVTTLVGLRLHSEVIERSNANHAAGLVARLLDADTVQVPGIITEMEGYRPWTDPLLRQELEKESSESRQRLHTSLALLPDRAQVEYLFGRLLDAQPDELPVIRDALEPHQQELIDRLWGVVEQPEKGYEIRRLRAAAALAKYDGDSARWQQASSAVVEQLVAENPVHLGRWLDAFRPVQANLLATLSGVFRDRKQERTAERTLATNILADFAAQRPDMLADLLMDADEKQFSVLFAKLRDHDERALAPLLAELDVKLQPKWTDVPLNPAWPAADAAAVAQIEAAHGLVHDRFALCQTMPLADFAGVSEALRASGYRPVRLRPYAGGRPLVAAAWTRDAQDSQLALAFSAEEIQKQNAEYAEAGYTPVDVAGYINDGQEMYAALWFKPTPLTLPSAGGEGSVRGVARMEVALEETELENRDAAIAKEGYRRATCCRFVGLDNKPRFVAIWIKVAERAAELASLFTGTEVDYSGGNFLADLQVDVHISPAKPTPSTQERYSQLLKNAEAKLAAKTDDESARFQRALALEKLGENEKALEDFSWLIGKYPTGSNAYGYRAIVHARLGKTQEAKDDQAKFQELLDDPSAGSIERARVEALVATYLGEHEAGMTRLDTAVAASAKDADSLYVAARAFAVAARVVAEGDADKAVAYRDRAVALLREAIANGYTNYLNIVSDADLDPLREHPGYLDLLKAGKLEYRYLGVWHPVAELTSMEVHGLDPAQHLVRCRELAAQGFRPASLSVLVTDDQHPSPQPLSPRGEGRGAGVRGGAVAASVWHRPVVPDDEKEKLGKRQANAAVALLRLNQAEKVWPLFQHSQDARARSYLIHRLSPLGTDAASIVQRLQDEREVSNRRALLLALGEFSATELSMGERSALIPQLLELYRTDPDAGIHGSVAWLLRQWGQKEKLQGIDGELTKLSAPSAPSPRLRGEGRGEGSTDRHWYVNGQGQTFVILPGPIEFLMGSPRTEAEREGRAEGPVERLHKARIDRSVALAACEVTVEQFLRFRKDHSYIPQYADKPDCPINGVTWYDAAAYCNWLSEQEGLAKDQWCYERNARGDYAEGMKAKPNYLQLSGYRLPTEAEWEYACRAGTGTSRYYGETTELLSHYAWYTENSLNRWMLPVGSLKPNDFGLFDMQGNALEWCHDRIVHYRLRSAQQPTEDRPFAGAVRDASLRVLRGGSFTDLPMTVRSAGRYRDQPTYRGIYVGFRAARTYN
jgi:formylglycine-generating enzyme required for sulfatase activity